MTNSIHCRIYYSVTGDPFSIHDKHNPEKVAWAAVQLNIYVIKRDETETETDLAAEDIQAKTELSIAHDIPAQQFFTSETWCMLENEQGQVLVLNDKNIFPISLYRNMDKPRQLKIKFADKITGRLHWH